jgi:nitroreductase
MELRDAITTRRTHKAFGPDPVPHDVLDELFELARWAPNHHLTNPWRFRVLGPVSLHALKQAAGPEAAGKLDRAPTLVAVTSVRSDDPVADEEDLLASAVAAYIVLLGAHDRGLVGYWRTPEVLRRPEGLRALEIDPASERFVGLIHLGHARQSKDPPDRAATTDVVIRLR